MEFVDAINRFGPAVAAVFDARLVCAGLRDGTGIAEARTIAHGGTRQDAKRFAQRAADDRTKEGIANSASHVNSEPLTKHARCCAPSPGWMNRLLGIMPANYRW
jgi:hypothetical protein